MDFCFFFFQAEDGIRDSSVTGVQTCALPIYEEPANLRDAQQRRAHTRSGLMTSVPGDALQVFTLGRFEALLPSSAGHARWPRLRGAARLLLACLLSAPGGYLAREQLLEALRPG